MVPRWVNCNWKLLITQFLFFFICVALTLNLKPIRLTYGDPGALVASIFIFFVFVFFKKDNTNLSLSLYCWNKCISNHLAFKKKLLKLSSNLHSHFTSLLAEKLFMIKNKKKAQIQPSSALRTYSSKTEIHKDGLVFSLKSASVREKRRNLVPFYSRIFSDFNAVHFWTFPTF